MSSKSSFKAKLAGAKLPERTVELCLNGDLIAKHEEAERELEAAEKTAVDSLAGTGAGPIIERIDALEAEMQEATQTFTLRALPHRRSPKDDRPTYRELMKAHPPRRAADGEVVESDAESGYNVDAFNEALVRLSVIDPVLDEDDWAELFTVISEGQFSVLAVASLLLNRSPVSVPFSQAASEAKRATADA